MKKLGVIFLGLLLIGLASAICTLDANLINQDPYPAVPGGYVKVVFQLDGLADSGCNMVSFEVEEEYPFEFDPDAETKVVVSAGTYTRNFKNSLILPYRIKIDENALDGESEISVMYSSDYPNEAKQIQDFNITIEDSRTDFEVHIKDYSYVDKSLILDILNIGDKDIEALTAEIPEQEGIEIIGVDKIIMGDVDSNEDETVTFTGEISGEYIDLVLYYTDQIGVRRRVDKTVYFNKDNFERAYKENNSNGISTGTWVVILVIIVCAGYFVWRRMKNKNRKR